MHVVDWYPTFCFLAGVDPSDGSATPPGKVSPGDPPPTPVSPRRAHTAVPKTTTKQKAPGLARHVCRYYVDAPDGVVSPHHSLTEHRVLRGPCPCST